jgi:arginyl-tRNA synthetase
MKEILNFIIKQVQTVYQPDEKELKRVGVEFCKIKAHGDLTTNALMILKKKLPDDFAEILKGALLKEFPIVKIDLVGPGFLNMTFTVEFWQKQLLQELNIESVGQGQKILLEFLSANPTGPIHIGHARNAILGDVTARILKAVGYNVTTEYYVNDAGAQVDHLAASLKLRYKQVHEGIDVTDADFAGDMYPGEYLLEIAESMKVAPENFKNYAVAAMLELIKRDLKKLDIEFDVFTSERSLIEKGQVQAAFDYLKEQGYIKKSVLERPKDFDGEWEAREQSVFESTRYGDDQDRAMIKSDGSWTYFASDVAYHYDKYKRGFNHMLNVFGADHIGYIKRLESAVKAMSDEKAHLDILVCQLVKFMKNGEPLKMSKRANTFITMRDVVDEIGADALRFLLLMRRHDMAYDFDLQKAVEKTKDNPVFYVQYATARIGSLMRRYEGECSHDSLSLLKDEAELDLIKTMMAFPLTVVLAAQHLEPHRVANYAYQLASDFHSLWSKDGYRFLVEGDSPLSSARMVLARTTLEVLQQALDLLGVQALLEM